MGWGSGYNPHLRLVWTGLDWLVVISTRGVSNVPESWLIARMMGSLGSFGEEKEVGLAGMASFSLFCTIVCHGFVVVVVVVVVIALRAL